MQGAPKFSKVELILKDRDSTDKDFIKNIKLEFEDAGMMITGDYIIIVIDEKADMTSTTSSTGKIFHMSEVVAYKTHRE